MQVKNSKTIGFIAGYANNIIYFNGFPGFGKPSFHIMVSDTGLIIAGAIFGSFVAPFDFAKRNRAQTLEFV